MSRVEARRASCEVVIPQAAPRGMLLHVAMSEWVGEAKTKSAREEDEYGIGFLVFGGSSGSGSVGECLVGRHASGVAVGRCV